MMKRVNFISNAMTGMALVAIAASILTVATDYRWNVWLTSIAVVAAIWMGGGVVEDFTGKRVESLLFRAVAFEVGLSGNASEEEKAFAKRMNLRPLNRLERKFLSSYITEKRKMMQEIARGRRNFMEFAERVVWGDIDHREDDDYQGYQDRNFGGYL